MANHNFNSEQFVEKVTKLLEIHDYSAAVNLFKNDNNKVYLKNNCWDLIPIFCKHITKEARENNNDLASCSEELLEILAMEANPEEGILEFLEQMDEADTTKFPIILNLLRILLNRDVLKENRLKSLEWTLNSIRSYIENFPFDEIYNEFDSTENDNKLCDTEQILEILSVLNHVLTFFEYFVEEAVENPVEAHELNILISSRLLQMFDILLPCINIDKVPDMKIYKYKIQSLILKLISNPMHLLQYVFFRAINVSDLKSKSSKSEIDECNDGFLNGCDVTNVAYNVNPFEDITVVSNLSYGMFFFSIFSENEHEDIKLPMVYNPKHIMLSLIYVTIPFFEKKTKRKSIICHISTTNLILSVVNV